MSPKTRTFLARIHQIENLSAGHRHIAELLLGHPQDSPFWGIEEVAERAETSPSAVVRFAKRLGYSGFAELRQHLIAEMRVRAHGEDRLLAAPKGITATLAEVARHDIQNLHRLSQVLDEKQLNGVVRCLERAHHRVLIGHGISWVMAQHLGYLLTVSGMVSVAGNPAEFARQVANLSLKDVLVAFSFPPYSQETLNVVNFARKGGVPVIAFTDRLDSPLALRATHALAVPGENLFFSHSLSAFNALAHTLATTLASRNPERALGRLREAEQVAEAQFTEDWKG